jgi:hypothetical protein
MAITPTSRAKAPPTSQRKCGRCTKCCSVIEVREISKPGQQTCPNECADGCAIYATRPKSCRDFSCNWLRGEGVDEERPDKLGIFFYYFPFRQLNQMILICQEAWPQAFQQPRVKALITARSRTQLVLIRSEKALANWLLGPPRELLRVRPIIDAPDFTADPAIVPPPAKIRMLEKMLD